LGEQALERNGTQWLTELQEAAPSLGWGTKGRGGDYQTLELGPAACGEGTAWLLLAAETLRSTPCSWGPAP